MENQTTLTQKTDVATQVKNKISSLILENQNLKIKNEDLRRQLDEIKVVINE